MVYIAHTYNGKEQTLKEHSENTAELCRKFAIPEMKDFMYTVGLLHDAGKYTRSFQKQIRSGNVEVEHSACGAQVTFEKYSFYMALMMAYCIAGHHTGIPDGGNEWISGSSDKPTLSGRINRESEKFGAYKKELNIPDIDFKKWLKFVMTDCSDMAAMIDQYAFLTRYSFSCLVDADSIDAGNLYHLHDDSDPDFQSCLDEVNKELFKSQDCLILDTSEADIFILNMPEENRMLVGIKAALENAIKYSKKRIIYVAPYNNIVNQAFEIFHSLFGDKIRILRHQSTFVYEDDEWAQNAIENWDAPFIITTTAQLFGSVYSNERRKLRKLHNMSDSIFVFDETDLIPLDYLQPCLQAFVYITKFLNSKTVLMGESMPGFASLIEKYTSGNCTVSTLINNSSSVSPKREYRYIGKISDKILIDQALECPSSLIVVNKKQTAQKLCSELKAKVFHLSTYMCPIDRKTALDKIRKELNQIKIDFPGYKNVPGERRIIVVSTSVIETETDLNFFKEFRELSGLGDILQTGKMVNRNGSQKSEQVIVFDFEDKTMEIPLTASASITQGLFEKYKNVSDPVCVKEYYDRLYSIENEKIQENTIHNLCSDPKNIPFKTYAENFDFLKDKTIPVFVVRDEKSANLADMLRKGESVAPKDLQDYICSVRQDELELLIRENAVIDFWKIYCLADEKYYDQNTGILIPQNI